jgi:hypothetical protein
LEIVPEPVIEDVINPIPESSSLIEEEKKDDVEETQII